LTLWLENNDFENVEHDAVWVASEKGGEGSQIFAVTKWDSDMFDWDKWVLVDLAVELIKVQDIKEAKTEV